MSGFELTAALEHYRRRHPDRAELVAEFAELAREGAFAFGRQRLAGHFTASAWLLSADGARVLLTHHRKLGRWLQLGGHADGDQDLPRAALREAMEESGLADLQLQPAIYDLDRHRIPGRGEEPEHWHYDVRFLVRCRGSEQFTVSDESHALAWIEVEAVLADPAYEPSLRRMAEGCRRQPMAERDHGQSDRKSGHTG